MLLKSDMIRDQLDDIVEGVIRGSMWLDPETIAVEVDDGVVRLQGKVDRRSEVERFNDVIVTAARHMVDRWQDAIAAVQPIRVDHELTALTLSVLVKAVLGADLDGIGPGFGAAVDAINGFMGRYLPGEDGDRADMARRLEAYLSAKRFLDGVVSAILAGRRTVGEQGRSDLLGAILAAGDQVSAAELRDQVLTLIMAGHETTANFLI